MTPSEYLVYNELVTFKVDYFNLFFWNDVYWPPTLVLLFFWWKFRQTTLKMNFRQMKQKDYDKKKEFKHNYIGKDDENLSDE